MVYQLLFSESGWIEQNIYGFTVGNDGADPFGGLTMDAFGNLYGTTSGLGSGGGGTVFKLTHANDGWSLTTLHSFSGTNYPGPRGALVMDSNGNLYGTTFATGNNGQGEAFKLSPTDGGWTYTLLHEFTGEADGGMPYCNLLLDANGNIYGTASAGGAYGYGVVFEITP